MTSGGGGGDYRDHCAGKFFNFSTYFRAVTSYDIILVDQVTAGGGGDHCDPGAGKFFNFSTF